MFNGAVKMNTKWCYCMAGISLIAAIASAQTKEQRLADLLKKYPEADTNKDGTLSEKEAKAYRARMQAAKKHPRQLPPPTHANVVYGTHERNLLDLWLATSDKPTPLLVYIHGGGFRAGDKSKIGRALIETMNTAGISVASINYRFKDGDQSRFEGEDPLYPAILHDGARALQFLRHSAETYNLDKTRFAATGGSAGANMLMWLGFHPDLAQPDHADPVLRESSRLQVLAPRGGQTTTHGPTFLEWFGVESLNLSKQEGTVLPSSDQQYPSEQELALSLDASPITHLTPDDPPIYQYYGGRNTPVTETTLWGVWVHHPLLGIKLKEAMDELGMENYLEYRDGPPIEAYASQYDFIIQKLKSLPAKAEKQNDS
jgi:acetyl esterase/lipase